jgi:hypothetical protein
MALNMERKVSESNWRFERKYALSASEFLQFEKLLLLSDLEELHAKRTINNCYLDDVKHSAFTESIEGYSEKAKSRFRWYGDFFQTTKPTLEFKLKQNNSNRKELFKLFETRIHEDLNWSNYVQKVREFIKSEYDFQVSERLEPVLLNSYNRSYYSDFKKTFRLTVDENLKFLSPVGALKNQQSYTIDRYIIELKFDNEKNISNFALLKNLGKFSKFTTGVSLIN